MTDTPKDPLTECRDVLAILVAELRDQNAHSGFEAPDGDYVDVQLRAGDIRLAVAAVNRAGGE